MFALCLSCSITQHKFLWWYETTMQYQMHNIFSMFSTQVISTRNNLPPSLKLAAVSHSTLSTRKKATFFGILVFKIFFSTSPFFPFNSSMYYCRKWFSLGTLHIILSIPPLSIEVSYIFYRNSLALFIPSVFKSEKRKSDKVYGARSEKREIKWSLLSISKKCIIVWSEVHKLWKTKNTNYKWI